MEVAGSSVFTYTVVMYNNMLMCAIYTHDVTTSTPSQTAFTMLAFGLEIDMPVVTIIKDSILFSYRYTVSGDSHIIRLAKSNLVTKETISADGLTAGVYLSEHDMFVFYDSTQEGVIVSP